MRQLHTHQCRYFWSTAFGVKGQSSLWTPAEAYNMMTVHPVCYILVETLMGIITSNSEILRCLRHCCLPEHLTSDSSQRHLCLEGLVFKISVLHCTFGIVLVCLETDYWNQHQFYCTKNSNFFFLLDKTIVLFFSFCFKGPGLFYLESNVLVWHFRERGRLPMKNLLVLYSIYTVYIYSILYSITIMRD